MNAQVWGNVITAAAAFVTAVVVARLTGQWGTSWVRLRHVERLVDLGKKMDQGPQDLLLERAAYEAEQEVLRLKRQPTTRARIATGIFWVFLTVAVTRGYFLGAFKDFHLGKLLAGEVADYVKVDKLTVGAAVAVLVLERLTFLILSGAYWYLASAVWLSLQRRTWKQTGDVPPMHVEIARALWVGLQVLFLLPAVIFGLAIFLAAAVSFVAGVFSGVRS